VRLGEYNLTANPDCDECDDLHRNNCECVEFQEITKFDIITHNGYYIDFHENDIGLIKLKEEVKFSNKNIQTICLPFEPAMLNVHEVTKQFVFGWGQTENSKNSDVLLRAEVRYVESQKCQKVHALIQENMFCALGTSKNEYDTNICK
jgi:secreted trypsin-like serine protease